MATRIGKSGADRIEGTSDPDIIEGRGGDDTVFGFGGRDSIYGGDGADTIYGGAGGDRLYGGDGKDKIYGSFGNDQLFGGFGDDTMSGGADSDLLSGGSGEDQIDGGAGNDTASYEGRTDRLTLTLADADASGVSGPTNQLRYLPSEDMWAVEDTLTNVENLIGGSGRDDIYGNNIGNTLSGLAGADWIEGRGGSDHIKGGAGRDSLLGGPGADAFYFSSAVDGAAGSANFDIIYEFVPGSETIFLAKSAFATLRSEGTGGTLDRDQFCIGTDNSADQTDDRITYNTTTGRIYYDSNGSAANTASTASGLIAQLNGGNHPENITFDDFALI